LHNGKNQNVFGNPLVGGLDPNFGYETKGYSSDIVANQIKGSVFTITETGTAQSITVYLSQYLSNLPKVKCAIYKRSDLSLIAVTIEWTLTSGWDNWKTFSFASPPTLTINTAYVLVVWYDLPVRIFYDAGDTDQLLYSNQNYDGFPDPWVPAEKLPYKISIYCTYTAGGATTYTKTYTADVLFKKLGIPKTYTVDTLLQKALTKIYTADVLFKKPNITTTYNIDTLLKKAGLTKTYDIDVLFKKRDITKTYLIDTVFTKAQAYIKTYLIDTLFKKGILKDYQIDALFQKLGLTKTYTTDTVFALRQTKTYNVDTLLQKIDITATYTIDTIIGAPTPELPFGGGFPFWWEKAEAWAPSLFNLFRKERAIYQTQVQFTRKETVTVPSSFKIAKPERNEIKAQPILAIRKGEVESKREIKAETVLAKKENRQIQAQPFKTAEPAITIIPAEIKMMTYPEILQTVKEIHKIKKRRKR
jgi:hypothetical protein